ncbi:hypothetical protein BH09MYX1_BH09MYX1_56130 [soil metagenome]
MASRNKLPRRRFAALAVFGTLGLTLGLMSSPTDALAQAPAVKANADIMVLHATQSAGAGSIDPQIGNVPQLKKPPFSSYNTYKLLDRKGLALQKGTAVTYVMPNKRVLQVTLQDVTADGRFKIAAAINDPSGGPFLKLLEVTAAANETFFVAGQSYDGGILVIGFTVKP